MRLATKVTEKEFQSQVLTLAHLQSWLCYHTFDSRRSAAGFPDLTLVRERVVFIELKTDTGKLSASQEHWIAALRKAGAEVHVFRPSQWDEIEDVLRRPR